MSSPPHGSGVGSSNPSLWLQCQAVLRMLNTLAHVWQRPGGTGLGVWRRRLFNPAGGDLQPLLPEPHRVDNPSAAHVQQMPVTVRRVASASLPSDWCTHMPITGRPILREVAAFCARFGRTSRRDAHRTRGAWLAVGSGRGQRQASVRR